VIPQTDYASDPAALADLLERVVFGDENKIHGRQLLLVRNAIDDLRGKGLSAMERRSLMEATAARRKLQKVSITMRGLEFWQLYACVEGAKRFDCGSDTDIPLIVYYWTDYSDGRPELCLHEVVSPAPIVMHGEYCHHVIHAYEPLLFDMCQHLRGVIRERAECEVCEAEAA
jgi:hypothetical protein